MFKRMDDKYTQLNENYKELNENVTNMKRNQEEMKNDIAAKRNTMEGLKSRVEEAEDRISELEDKGLCHSLDTRHVNPHFPANELEAFKEQVRPFVESSGPTPVGVAKPWWVFPAIHPCPSEAVDHLTDSSSTAPPPPVSPLSTDSSPWPPSWPATPQPYRCPVEVLSAAMSDSDDGNQAPGGRESPVGMVGAWVGEDGDQDALILNSGPQGDGDDAAAAMVAAEVAEAMESLGEEARAVGDPESSTSEEDSDIGPAEEEEEENMEPGPEMALDAHQFPMVGFRFMFLNLLHALLHRMHYNNHILMRPRGIRRMSRSRHQRSGRMAQIRVILMPEGSRERVVAMVPHGSRERVVAMVPHGSRERVVAMVHESADGPERFGPGIPALPEPEGLAGDMVEETAAGEMAEEAQEEPAQEAEAPRETTEEEAQDAESKEDKEELNEKQEGPEKVVDPSENRSRKSRYLCVALNITQPFLAFTCY
ncbi:hypothetical protein QTO34_000236 [Cnephaeus nilssonii]|uniref:Uncharacterized protein n=1 Tax=Cnephaeus nilssonii TaxID=3371016 RepID=A0AA40LU82_CNENI|nr:hypothetical protein QTO34_000236 [Eptesicus nilssonii]